jgi:hypothetical protein
MVGTPYVFSSALLSEAEPSPHGCSLAHGMVEHEERLVLFAQRLHNVGLVGLLTSEAG